jgi:hypothetical protein
MATATICMRLIGALEINCRGSEFTEPFPPESIFTALVTAKYHQGHSLGSAAGQ